MTDHSTARLVAVAALALVLFTYPVLAGPGAGTRVLGVPLAAVLLFGAWALVVVLLLRTSRD